MSKRHESIGIKQVIRFEWMQKTTNLLLSGLNVVTIRQELHQYLADKKGDGTCGGRSNQTRTFIVTNLMNVWVTPVPDLITFRDASLALLHKNPSMALPIHWGMISAAYPFWYHVARQMGRLLALQNQVTQKQIINRLKEQYGDRQTVSRYTQYIIRSFVAWGVIEDAMTKGCYEKKPAVNIVDIHLVILMFESALLANSEGNGTLELLQNNPGFFPFGVPLMNSDLISQHSERLAVYRYGLDDVLLKLNNTL